MYKYVLLCFDDLPDDIVRYIKQFLNNNEIIQFMCTSRKNSLALGVKNIFTTIKVNRMDDIFNYYKHYMNHKKSIVITTLYQIDEPELWWPFESPAMKYIDCDVKQPEIVFKNVKKIFVKYNHHSIFNIVGVEDTNITIVL
jgi:hypothetical protein